MSKRNKTKARPVDMSLPPEARRRRRKQGSVGGTPPAQMSHASSPKSARTRRDGERKLAAMNRLRGKKGRPGESLGGG